MKIFAFNLASNSRGALLANAPRPTFMKGICKPEGGSVAPLGRIYQQTEFASRFDDGGAAYNPATYGVDAICFCIGELAAGGWNDAERAANGWEWHVVTAAAWQPDPSKQTRPVPAASRG